MDDGLILQQNMNKNGPSSNEISALLEDGNINAELKNSLEKIIKSYQEELQKMASRIIDVQEEERKKISRNLHDGLGQNLYSHLITINLLKSQMEHPLIEQMHREAAQLIEEVREISWELRPAVLDDLGLVPAIRSYLARFSEYYGIDVQFESQIHKRYNITIDLTIYRIIQEALTNVRKYADTDKVCINLTEKENVVNVIIKDYGKGFDLKLVSRGVGIFSMEERAHAVGGIFKIESIPGKGTKICLEIPLK
ncbi:sensor histidine kinase [Neobacillus sp. LXY-4]|uniref:sensor histidine kinase n=1 Tax=Neobacillus sp. LXY-4 TaxID=3379826 RepID=UPI003EE324F8